MARSIVGSIHPSFKTRSRYHQNKTGPPGPHKKKLISSKKFNKKITTNLKCFFFQNSSALRYMRRVTKYKVQNLKINLKLKLNFEFELNTNVGVELS